jgi:FKBP-type peptidyl-prolyl cis-trans isomerase 2
MGPARACAALVALVQLLPAHGLVPPARPAVRPSRAADTAARAPLGRRATVHTAALGLLGAGGALAPGAAHALIKGSAPPPKMAPPKERKCKSIDECEALGERTKAEAAASERTDFERTAGGDRYRDLVAGEGRAVAAGDAVEIRYRVMRLGTKARDGLSGEGQTIFSLGYGEDEDREGETLAVQLSGRNLVAGVNDGLVGMRPGGRRRVLVRPERGWRETTGACAEGTKSLDLTAQQRTTAVEGNLVFKADIGAAIDNVDACQNKASLPQPRTYGGRARFGRRFDESLLVELDLVGYADAKQARAPTAPARHDPRRVARRTSSPPLLAQVAKAAGGSLDYDPKVDRCRQNPFADGCDDGVPVK